MFPNKYKLVVGKKCFQNPIKRADGRGGLSVKFHQGQTPAVLPPRNAHGLKFGNKKAKKEARKSRAMDDDALNTRTKT